MATKNSPELKTAAAVSAEVMCAKGAMIGGLASLLEKHLLQQDTEEDTLLGNYEISAVVGAIKELSFDISGCGEDLRQASVA